MKKNWIFYFSCFFCGLAVMAVEILATRMIAPYFGNSLYVWTNVVGLTMLALSLGYYFGGKMADRHKDEKIYFFIILLTGIWIFLSPFFSKIFLSFLAEFSTNLSLFVRWGSFFAVLILFVFPQILFGMIVPFSLKFVAKDLKEIGNYSGRISALSTFGSILGTFLPAFVLIPYIGTSKSFFMLGALLILIAIIGFKIFSKSIFILLIFVGFFINPPKIFAAKNIIYQTDSPYHHIFVKQRENRFELYLDSQFGIHSIYDKSKPILDEYYSYFALLPPMINEPKNILILGHAGGSFTRIFNAYYPDLKITGIEIDPKITETAQKFFDLDKLKVDIIHADARSFLLKDTNRYDLILVDTYFSTGIPSHLATDEFFSLAKNHLNPDGILALNLASSGEGLEKIIPNTLAKSFSKVYNLQIPHSFNIMVFAGENINLNPQMASDFNEMQNYLNQKLQTISYEPSAQIFTDDKSNIDKLSEKMLMNFLSVN